MLHSNFKAIYTALLGMISLDIASKIIHVFSLNHIDTTLKIIISGITIAKILTPHLFNKLLLKINLNSKRKQNQK